MTVYTLRPNADRSVGFGTIYPTTPTTHYDKVDEATSDEDATYIESTPDLEERDIFEIPDLGSVPPIAGITLYVRTKTAHPAVFVYPQLQIGGTFYFGDKISIDIAGDYVTYSTTWAKNPATGNDWTAADINAMGIGALASPLDYGANARITQIWLKVECIDKEVNVSDSGVGTENISILKPPTPRYTVKIKRE